MKKQILLSILALFFASSYFAQGGGTTNNAQAVIPWKANGNEAAAEHFIGTTNQRDLVFKSFGLESLRLTSDRGIKLEGFKLPEIDTTTTPRLMLVDRDGLVKVIDIEAFIEDRILLPEEGQETCDPNTDHVPRWVSIRSDVANDEPGRMYIDGTFCRTVYVGVGTHAPRYPLHVKGDAYYMDKIGLGTVPGDAQLKINSGGAKAISVWNSDSEQFRIGNNGGIYTQTVLGVGTFSPRKTFEVNGTGYVGGAQFQAENDVQFQVKTDQKIAMSVWQRSASNDREVMRLYVGGSTQKAFSIVDVSASSTNKDVFRIMADGKAWATEMNVRLMQNFPDYVFKDNYNLMPIEQLEAYIQLNGHLPNIPKAAEVEAEGINLGEMQVKQLEKIEELTLYIIEQQKLLKQLQQEVEQLKQEKR